MSVYCYLYGLVIIFSTVQSHPIQKKIKSVEDNQDYESFVSEYVETTLSPMASEVEANNFNETQFDQKANIQVKKAVKDTGNRTVIIVFVLIVMTIIVKTLPVIIAYSLPYFYADANTKTDDNPKKESKECQDDFNKEIIEEDGIPNKIQVQQDCSIDKESTHDTQEEE